MTRCRICRELFSRTNNAQKFCGKSCRLVIIRKQQRAYFKKSYPFRKQILIAKYNKWLENPVNRRRHNLRTAAWKKRNKDKVCLYSHRRRVLIRVAGEYNIEDWRNIKRAFSFKCAICKKKKKLTVDHIIPVSKGGSNVRENIQPLCLSCNASKGNK